MDYKVCLKRKIFLIKILNRSSLTLAPSEKIFLTFTFSQQLRFLNQTLRWLPLKISTPLVLTNSKGNWC